MRLQVRLTGGIAGFDRELTVQGDGTAVFVDHRTGRRVRFRVSPEEVEQALVALQPFIGQREVGTPYPDMFVYTITVHEGARPRTVTFYVGQVSDRALEALQPIQRWLDQGAASSGR